MDLGLKAYSGLKIESWVTYMKNCILLTGIDNYRNQGQMYPPIT